MKRSLMWVGLYAWWKSYIMIKTVIEEYAIGKRPPGKIV